MKANVRIAASPRARRAMRQRGIDPAAVHGTGPGGRIVEADVLRAAAVPGQTAAASQVAGSHMVGGQSAVSQAGGGDGLSLMRRAVAANVAESFATVPHFYLRSEVDVTPLVQLRNQSLEAVEKRCGQRPSLTDFLLRAMILALRECPQANRIWQQDSIVDLPSIDIGLVVQVGDGLLVPVIHRADRLNMIELVQERAALLAALRAGKTSPDSFQGAATSLTNLGKHRVDEFAPIISPPQSSMLAVGRMAERPAAFEGRVCLRQTMHLTLAVDHRVMDGVPAAEFLDRIVDFLERPFLLLCDTSSHTHT
jgi:pyruvate dehydrogenase E2 component (dihydrolipoamide acetyltransferase)